VISDKRLMINIGRIKKYADIFQKKLSVSQCYFYTEFHREKHRVSRRIL